MLRVVQLWQQQPASARQWTAALGSARLPHRIRLPRASLLHQLAQLTFPILRTAIATTMATEETQTAGPSTSSAVFKKRSRPVARVPHKPTKLLHDDAEQQSPDVARETGEADAEENDEEE